jgi:hypothetical protein
MRNIFFEAEDCPLSEVDRLMNTSSKDLGVVELSGVASTLSGWTLIVALILHQN